MTAAAAARVAVVAGDAGSASVLIPVVTELARRGAAVAAHVSGPAAALFREAGGIGFEEHAEPVAASAAAAWLAGARLLVCGAGAFNSIEHVSRVEARRGGVASLAVVDYWGRASERFSRGAGGQLERALPDLACALEAHSRAELAAAGLPEDRIVVTGSPYLETVARFFALTTPQQRAAGRAEEDVAEDERLVLFASEAFDAADRDPQGRSLLGYDQASSLGAVLRAADAVARRRGCRFLVVARPHPREGSRALAEVAGAWPVGPVRVRVTRGGDARRWVLLADVVTGMTSVVLVEAALAGRPCLSVQIGRRETGRSDPNLADALGLSLEVLEDAQLIEALDACVAGKGFVPDRRLLATLAGPGCAARVADLALSQAALWRG